MDEDGLILSDLEEKVAKYRPKFLYTIPTFQNPTGRNAACQTPGEAGRAGEKNMNFSSWRTIPTLSPLYGGGGAPPSNLLIGRKGL